MPSCSSGARSGAAPLRIRETRNADHTSVAAVAAKTAPVPVTASRSPPRAGPRNEPTLSIALELTLAAVSSSGVRASDGSSAACAGRNVFEATATKVASA